MTTTLAPPASQASALDTLDDNLLDVCHPVDSNGFMANWWRHLAPKFNIRQSHGDWVLLHQEKVKGLITFKELRLTGWNYGWSQELTKKKLADFKTITQQTKWDYAALLCAESKDIQAVEQSFRDLGLPTLVQPHTAYAMVDLSQGFETYLKGLSANDRRNFRTKLKKAAKLNPQFIDLPSNSPENVDDFFQRFFPPHIAYWDQKTGHSYLNDPRERDFILSWAKTLQQSGNLLLQALHYNGEEATLNMNIVVDNTLYWPLVINTGRYNDYFPGIVNLYLMFELAAQRGIQTINLAPGAYQYKKQAASYLDPIHKLMVFNPASLTGRAYHQYLKQKVQAAQSQAAKV